MDYLEHFFRHPRDIIFTSHLEGDPGSRIYFPFHLNGIGIYPATEARRLQEEPLLLQIVEMPVAVVDGGIGQQGVKHGLDIRGFGKEQRLQCQFYGVEGRQLWETLLQLSQDQRGSHLEGADVDGEEIPADPDMMILDGILAVLELEDELLVHGDLCEVELIRIERLSDVAHFLISRETRTKLCNTCVGQCRLFVPIFCAILCLIWEQYLTTNLGSKKGTQIGCDGTAFIRTRKYV